VARFTILVYKNSARGTDLRLLIVTSCTGEKASKPQKQLTLEDFRQGPDHVAQREADVEESLLPAGEMYTGQQHVRLMRGVQTCRETNAAEVDLWVLSAGYGMIPEHRMIAPYECTFQGMKVGEICALADQLNIPSDFRKAVSKPYDMALILLGDAYLRACALDHSVKFSGPALLFCGTGMAKRLPEMDHAKIVTLSNPEAKRFSCGLVALKGEMASRVLSYLKDSSEGPAQLTDPKTDVLGLLDGGGPIPTPKPAKKPFRANPKVDKVITMPEAWWDKPHRTKLRYFIPEWDDLVDPDYDFLNDEHSGGQGDWSNEVYAHQMYPEPNYDGILMSRAVAEKSKKKKARINEMGVHRYLRVPRQYPIMGDCGAFDYIGQEVPPYSTEDVIDYYTRLDFDYGVSVDHLIVKGTEDQKDFRYALTIQNAEDFLKQHKAAGLKWSPIGAVQGWDPQSYAHAAEQYVKMGYRYVGLGGLVRSSTKVICGILEEVHKVVPPEVSVHLFGIARLAAMPKFSRLGVRSVDSASPLRRAWLGGKDNYWTQDGTHYRAIRIPEAGKSFRAKNMVKEGRATEEFVVRTEKRCYDALHALDAGKMSSDQVLTILDEYDHLITEDRGNMREEYGRTLQDQPWKSCPCSICKRDGVDVVIFRGNNRNRRRGFHNTFIFYRLLQAVLTGQHVAGVDILIPSPQMDFFKAAEAT